MLNLERGNSGARTNIFFRIKPTIKKGHAMCQKINCENCGKATWTGCGQHVEQALAGVAPADRCTCK